MRWRTPSAKGWRSNPGEGENRWTKSTAARWVAYSKPAINSENSDSDIGAPAGEASKRPKTRVGRRVARRSAVRPPSELPKTTIGSTIAASTAARDTRRTAAGVIPSGGAAVRPCPGKSSATTSRQLAANPAISPM
jgi:hypothetical protein